VIGTNVQLGSTRVLLLAVAPLVLASVSCTATVEGPEGGAVGAGASASGGNASGGTSGSKATGGTGAGNVGQGGSSSGGSSSGGSSSGSSGSSGDGGSGATPAARPVSMEGAPIYSRFLRLTNDQWENSVRDILRLTAPTGLSDGFLHAVSGTTDFENNERVVIVNDTIWSDFQLAAETLAKQVTATDAALQNVVATTDATTFINTFGRRAFRRDLTPAEVTTYSNLHATGAGLSGSQSAFTKGARLVITGMLQSPHFLYRIELGDAGAPLNGYEMAAKLSLWINDTTPSDSLLDAAKAGKLDAVSGAVEEASALLEAPAALDVMRKFHAELYKLALFETITKDSVPGYSEGLKAEFTQAASSFFDYVYGNDLGVRDILTTNVAFAGPLTAALYGVSVSGNTVQQVSVPDRAGWYSQAPFLTLWAVNNDPDSIHRGVRINLDTLCADPGLPEMNLPAVPAIEDGQTNRERYTALTQTCGRECHGLYINPVGFAFENYDGVGRFRETDHGKPVDTTGTYAFAEGYLSFAGAPELMELIASGTQAHQCWAKKMATYALARDVVDAERPLVEALGQVSRDTGGTLKQVMLALVQNDAFRTHVGGAQ
jgi:hypothetical protein